MSLRLGFMKSNEPLSLITDWNRCWEGGRKLRVDWRNHAESEKRRNKRCGKQVSACGPRACPPQGHARGVPLPFLVRRQCTPRGRQALPLRRKALRTSGSREGGPAAFPAVRVLAAPPQDNPNPLGHAAQTTARSKSRPDKSGRYISSCVLSLAAFPTPTREAANIGLPLLLPFAF